MPHYKSFYNLSVDYSTGSLALAYHSPLSKVYKRGTFSIGQEKPTVQGIYSIHFLHSDSGSMMWCIILLSIK